MNKKRIAAAVCGILLSSCLISCAKQGDPDVQNGVTAYGAGRFEEALGYFNKALDQETRYSKELIYNFMSSTYAQMDDIENAALCMEKSVEGRPDYRSYVTLGTYWQSLKKYEKAEESYNKAVAMNDKKGEAYASLGILYLETGKPEKAVEYLELGNRYTPKIAVIHANLAVAYAQLGNIEKSDEELAVAEDLGCVNLDQFEAKIEKFTKQ